MTQRTISGGVNVHRRPYTGQPGVLIRNGCVVVEPSLGLKFLSIRAPDILAAVGGGDSDKNGGTLLDENAVGHLAIVEPYGLEQRNVRVLDRTVK